MKDQVYKVDSHLGKLVGAKLLWLHKQDTALHQFVYTTATGT